MLVPGAAVAAAAGLVTIALPAGLLTAPLGLSTLPFRGVVVLAVGPVLFFHGCKFKVYTIEPEKRMPHVMVSPPASRPKSMRCRFWVGASP